jgi:CHAT domain-containing protein
VRIFISTGRLSEAAKLLRELDPLVQRRERQGDGRHTILQKIRWAELHIARRQDGALAEAEGQLVAAVEIGQKFHPTSGEFFVALGTLALLREMQGDFHIADALLSAAADERLERASFLGGLTTLKAEPDMVPILNRLAHWQSLNGEHEQALRTLLRAHSRIEFRYGRESPEYASFGRMVVELQLADGSKTALNHAAEICAFVEKHSGAAQQSPLQRAIQLLRCAEVEALRGHHKTALGSLSVALKKFASVGAGTATWRIPLRIRWAQALVALDQCAEAARILDIGLREAREEGIQHHQTAELHRMRAELFLAQDQIKPALLQLEQALEIEERFLQSFSGEAQVRHQRQRSLDETEQLTLRTALHHQESAAAQRLALEVVLLRKGRALEAGQQAMREIQRQIRKGDAEAARLLEKYRLHLSERSQLMQHQSEFLDKLEEWQRKLQASEKAIQGSFEALRQRLPAIVKTTPAPNAIVSQVAQALPKDAALLEIALVRSAPRAAESIPEDQYLAFVLKPDGTVRWQRVGSRTKIDEQLSLFWANIKGSGSSPQGLAAERAVERALLAPFWSVLDSVAELILSVDGGWHYAPLAALRLTALDQKHLIERFAVTHVTSARELLRGHSVPAPSALIVAISDFQGTDQKDIPGAVSEGRSLVSLLPAAEGLFDRTASESGVRVALSHPHQLIHFATHGLFDQDVARSLHKQESKQVSNLERVAEQHRRGLEQERESLFRSMLLLHDVGHSGGNPEKDGRLTAAEIQALDFRGTQLVTASACESGRGGTVNGEGAYGLRKAFYDAGAEASLTTLWKIDDVAGCQFMGGFYGELIHGERDLSRALQTTMRAFIAAGTRENPTYRTAHWAGFVLSGKSGPVDLPQSSRSFSCAVK